MKERRTHNPEIDEEKEEEGNMLPLLIEWANREEISYRLIDAAMRGLHLSSSRESVLDGLSALASGMLSRMIPSSPVGGSIYWRQTVSVDMLRNNGGLFTFDTTASIQEQNPIKEWDRLCRIEPQTIRDAFRVFDVLKRGREGTMDARLLRICGVDGCGRFFISARSGARVSRACSKAHQAVLTARDLRASPPYLEREKRRNARRMAAVREAEKLVGQWTEEGKTPDERERLLWKWNEENGSVLGKKAVFNVLENEDGKQK